MSKSNGESLVLLLLLGGLVAVCLLRLSWGQLNGEYWDVLLRAVLLLCFEMLNVSNTSHSAVATVTNAASQTTAKQEEK